MSDFNPCYLFPKANTSRDELSWQDLQSNAFKYLSKLRFLYIPFFGTVKHPPVVSRNGLIVFVFVCEWTTKKASRERPVLANKVGRYLKGTIDLDFVFRRSEFLK